MALINCRECNKQVSQGANVCPNCGVKRPDKGSNTAYIIGGVCGVAIVLFITLKLLVQS